MRLSGCHYPLAALGAALAVAGCAAASSPAAGASAPAGSTSAPAASAQASGGTSATSSPAASGSLAAGTGAAGQGTVVAECTAAELKVSDASDGTASGQAQLTIRFTNTGPRGCFLQGYPGVAVSGPDGVVNAQRGAAQSPSQVTVQPGGTASAVVGWEFAPQDGSGVYTTGDCPGYQATQLLVTAPDQTTSTRFAAPGSGTDGTDGTPVCWGFGVSPVVSGASGRSS